VPQIPLCFSVLKSPPGLNTKERRWPRAKKGEVFQGDFWVGLRARDKGL